MEFVLLSPGKTLTEPLLLISATLIVLSAYESFKPRRDLRPRAFAKAVLAMSILLWAFGSGALTTLLWRVTDYPAPKVPHAPDVIVVPSAGSTSGEGVLSATCAERVAAAVRWWRTNPRALMVLTGADTTAIGPSLRTLFLMREEAVRRGVPPSRIMLEAASRNTHEHAVKLSELHGINRGTVIGVVTSPWHMRRTIPEFERYFDHVVPFEPLESKRPLTLNDFLPSASAMNGTTVLLHEWIGAAWYALRR